MGDILIKTVKTEPMIKKKSRKSILSLKGDKL